MDAPDPRTYPIAPEVIELLPESVVRESCVLPARADGRTITLFCPDDGQLGPLEKERVGFILQRPVAWWPASRNMIWEAITQHFGELPIVVHYCDVKFRFRCPRFWEQLRPTDDANVRFCEVCASNVYRAADASEANLLARQGKCVAFSPAEYCDETMGLIEFD